MGSHPGGLGRLSGGSSPRSMVSEHTGWGSGDPLLERVGNTPLVEIRNMATPASVRILAKCEWFNPGGSVKDRAALNMILAGERSGQLDDDRVILDSTSGNTGIAYALIAARRGYRVELAIPSNASRERIQILRNYGVKLHLTDPLSGSDGAIEVARALFRKHPGRYFYPDQYSNPANWQAHFRTTAPEILAQTQGRITHFVAGLGTTGTLTGVARRLKQDQPAIRCIGVIPDSPFHGLEGLKHLPTTRTLPAIFDPALVDQYRRISTEQAQKTVRELARKEGLLVGPSGGAVVSAALELAHSLETGTIVVLLPDGGQKYLSEAFWNMVEPGGGGEDRCSG